MAYDLRSVEFSVNQLDFDTQGARARLSVNVTTNVGFHAGYGYRVGRLDSAPGAEQARSRDLDLGLDFRRQLSISRRTRLGFTSGSAIVSDAARTTRYRLTGAATLNRDFGRTWTTAVVYRRGVQFIERFSEPFLSDAVTVGVSGYFSRRVDLAASVGYSIGDVGLADARGFDTYTGSVRLSVALTRHVAIDVEHLVHYYEFEDGVPLADGVARAFDRQSVRAGLRWWIPLLP